MASGALASRNMTTVQAQGKMDGRPSGPIVEAVSAVRACFETGRTRPIEWRARQLHGIERLCTEAEEEIGAALKTDLGKPFLEAYGTEIGFLKKEARHARKHLKEWLRPERVPSPLVVQPGRSEIRAEPLGVVLVIAPWNYPFQLALGPVVGAVAAGNAVIVKPSEVAPATSALIAELLPRYLDPDAVRVIQGGIPETTTLLGQRFDHIFYTGNGRVGRIVMRAAAEHLTPVTLELGGKSPAIVDKDIDLDITCRRIAFGKFTNAGQTCVAPDYALVHEEVYELFLERSSEVIREFFGDDPQASPSFARIINAQHHRRISALLEGQRAVCGGDGNESHRYIAPTLLRDVAPESPIMNEEIFGPVLPVVPVPSIASAIRFVNARPKPLALYVFSRSTSVVEDVIGRTSAGGVTVNHCMLHLAPPGLPFGGVGASGMGAYHGRTSFDTFSHRKAVLRKPLALDASLFYPPHDARAERWIRRLI